jgi:hypothetical protein
MSFARSLVLASTLALMSACATAPPPPPPFREAPPSATVFRPGDFSWSAVPGKGRIDGRLVFQNNGVRYTCQGMSVILTPETLWTRRRMTILYNSPERAALPVDEVRARTPSAPNDDYSAFVRRATCDAASRFSFSNLPDGSWFVITVAKPVAATGETMAIMRRVTVRGGRMIAVDL